MLHSVGLQTEVCWPMTVEVHIYLVDVQSVRTSILNISFLLSNEHNIRRAFKFVLIRSSVSCMLNLPASGSHISARQLACHHKYQGSLA